MRTYTEVRVLFFSDMSKNEKRAVEERDEYPSPEAVLEGLEFLMNSGASRDDLLTFIEENYGANV